MEKQTVSERLNKLAVQRYGVAFDRLSVFNQEQLKVDTYTPLEPKEETTSSKVHAENQELRKELEDVTRENMDLWEENEELKVQLYRQEKE